MEGCTCDHFPNQQRDIRDYCNVSSSWSEYRAILTTGSTGYLRDPFHGAALLDRKVVAMAMSILVRLALHGPMDGCLVNKGVTVLVSFFRVVSLQVPDCHHLLGLVWIV